MLTTDVLHTDPDEARELLTDFATVQYFGVQTISVGVYTQWKGAYDFASASQLSVVTARTSA